MLKVNGRYMTTSLFHDVYKTVGSQNLNHERPPMFSLYHDVPGMINCRTTFVDLNDPTGYKWAMEYLGDWMHFEALLRCEWFKKAYLAWVNEIKLKLKSDAMRRLMEIANSESSQALGAAKYLASQEWEKGTRGRPSKTEVSAALRREMELAQSFDEDLERIKLVKK